MRGAHGAHLKIPDNLPDIFRIWLQVSCKLITCLYLFVILNDKKWRFRCPDPPPRKIRKQSASFAPDNVPRSFMVTHFVNILSWIGWDSVRAWLAHFSIILRYFLFRTFEHVPSILFKYSLVMILRCFSFILFGYSLL